MLRLDELDIRTLDHHRRIADADRYGWLQQGANVDAPKMALGVALRAVCARVIGSALLRRGGHDREEASVTRILA